VQVPEDIMPLIHNVYGQDSSEDLPEPWRAYGKKMHANFLKEQMERTRKAESVALPHPERMSDYWRNPGIYREEDDDPNIHDDFRAVTRLGPASVTCICVHEIDGEWFLDQEGMNPVPRLEVPLYHLHTLLEQSFS